MELQVLSTYMYVLLPLPREPTRKPVSYRYETITRLAVPWRSVHPRTDHATSTPYEAFGQGLFVGYTYTYMYDVPMEFFFPVTRGSS
jgi:hypothetical protein